MRKEDDAGLRKRIRIFVEAIAKMVPPLFLAACVSLTKVDMGDHAMVRENLSILVGCTLAFGMLSLLPLTYPNWFPHNLFSYKFSVWCIHTSGFLLISLAYFILCIIPDEEAILLIIFVVVAVFTLIWTRLTVFNGNARGATAVAGVFLDDIENCVELLAAITFLLFLGLAGLVLGGQYRKIQLTNQKDMLPLFYHTIGLSFFVCTSAVFFMLVCMVPPVSNTKTTVDVYPILYIFNNIYGCALASIVLLITLGNLGQFWVAAAFPLSVLPFVVWALHWLGDVTGKWDIERWFGGAIGRGDEDVKPASLDLTKVTFTGFLAISVYTISENTPVSTREFSSWFIFLTAIAVNNSLGWRLLTHQKKPSAARFTAATVASLCAHICITAAVIPFGFMTHHALQEITCTTAPSPAQCS